MALSLDSRTGLLNPSTVDILGLDNSFFFLAAPRSTWALSSPTRDRPQVPGIGSTESLPLDHQGSPVDNSLLWEPSRVSNDARNISSLYPVNSTSTFLSPSLGIVLCPWRVKLPRVENHCSRVRQSWDVMPGAASE